VQVCTAAMVYGFRIVQEMVSGLSNYLDEKGLPNLAAVQGRAVPTVSDWRYLNLNHVSKAVIDTDACIECGRCHVVCEDTSHQAIAFHQDAATGARRFEVKEADCVGCNLCASICPVPGCITMRDLAPGEIDERTGAPVPAGHRDWRTHPNNPMRETAV